MPEKVCGLSPAAVKVNGLSGTVTGLSFSVQSTSTVNGKPSSWPGVPLTTLVTTRSPIDCVPGQRWLSWNLVAGFFSPSQLASALLPVLTSDVSV